MARNEVPIFAEGSEGRELRATGSLTLRPTKSVRAEGSLQLSQIDRAFDGSEYARTVIPRLKVEYQPTRALFFRVVSQYQAQRTSGLRTPTGRADLPAERVAVSGGEFGIVADGLAGVVRADAGDGGVLRVWGYASRHRDVEAVGSRAAE